MTLSICLKLSQTLRSLLLLLLLLLLLIISSSSSSTTLPLSLIVMMTFCKKSVHSFWGIASSMDSSTTIDKLLPCKCHADVSTTTPLVVGGGGGGLGLITATSVGDIQRSHNVVESSTIIKSTSSSPPSSPPPPSPSLSPFSIGRSMDFFDDISGGVIDGLMSCTESLGFESCDERRVDSVDEEIDHHRLSPAGGGGGDVSSSTRMEKWRKTEEDGMIMMRKSSRRREVKRFPPPLSSLDSNGQPSFFLRPVRKDGRLELTEVRIDRPEILRAHREDGRLRLHLIRNDRFFNTNEEQEHEEIHEEQEPEEEEEEEEEGEIKEEESREWRLRMTGEGFRRCHELLVSHHHDHHPHHHQSNHHLNLHVWSQHCVTTR